MMGARGVSKYNWIIIGVLIVGVGLFLWSLSGANVMLSPQAKADVNRDGKVDTSDYIAVRVCIGKPMTGTCAYADANGDGTVNTSDYVAIRAMMGQISSLCVDVENRIYENWTDSSGTVTYSGITFDSCKDNNTLMDWGCVYKSGKMIPNYTYMPCQYGCSNGACLPAPVVSDSYKMKASNFYTDSDTGINYTTFSVWENGQWKDFAVDKKQGDTVVRGMASMDVGPINKMYRTVRVQASRDSFVAVNGTSVVVDGFSGGNFASGYLDSASPENYKMKASNFYTDSDTGINYTTFSVWENGQWKDFAVDKKQGDTVIVGSNTMFTVGLISKEYRIVVVQADPVRYVAVNGTSITPDGFGARDFAFGYLLPQ